MAKEAWGLGNLLLGALFRRGSIKEEDLSPDYRMDPRRRSLRAETPEIEVHGQQWKRHHAGHGRDRYVAESRACAKIGSRGEGVGASRLLPTVGLATTRVDATEVVQGLSRQGADSKRERHRSHRQPHVREDTRGREIALPKCPDKDSDAHCPDMANAMGIMVPHSSHAAPMIQSASHVDEAPCGGELWLSNGMISQELALIPSNLAENPSDAQTSAGSTSHGRLCTSDDENSRKDTSLSMQLVEYAAACGSDQNSILDEPELWVGLLHDEVIGPELCTVLKKEVRHMVTKRGALASGLESSKDQACQVTEDIHATPPDKVIDGRHRQDGHLHVDETPAPLSDKWRFERVDLSQKCPQEDPQDQADCLQSMNKVGDIRDADDTLAKRLLSRVQCEDLAGDEAQGGERRSKRQRIEHVGGTITETSGPQDSVCEADVVSGDVPSGDVLIGDVEDLHRPDGDDSGEDCWDDAEWSAAALVPAFAKVMEHLHLREKVGLANLCQTSLEVLCDSTVWDSVLINIMDLSHLDSALSGLGSSSGSGKSMPKDRCDADDNGVGNALQGLLRVSHLRVDLSPRIPGAWTCGRSADPLGLLCQRVLPKFQGLECLELTNVEDVSLDFRFLSIRSTVLRDFPEVILSPNCGIFGDGTRMYSLFASKRAEKIDRHSAELEGRAEAAFMREHKAVVRNGCDNFHIAHAPWRCFQGHQVRAAYERILADFAGA